MERLVGKLCASTDVPVGSGVYADHFGNTVSLGREYMIYYVMASVYGMIVPLVLMLVKVITVRPPVVLCVGLCFLVPNGSGIIQE